MGSAAMGSIAGATVAGRRDPSADMPHASPINAAAAIEPTARARQGELMRVRMTDICVLPASFGSDR